MHIPLLFLGVLVISFLLLCLVQPTSAWPVVTAHPNDLRRPRTERLARRAPPPPVQPSVLVSPTRGRSNSPFQQNSPSGAGSGARDSDFNPMTGEPARGERQEQRLVGDDADPRNYLGHHFDSLLVPRRAQIATPPLAGRAAPGSPPSAPLATPPPRKIPT